MIPISTITKSQSLRFVKDFEENEKHYRITATVRYDDQCGNGHNTLSITGEIRRLTKRDGVPIGFETGGCIHDDIRKHFPELAHLIPFHLCNSNGPTRYIENTTYLAGERDYNGLLKGEFQQFTDRNIGLPSWKLDFASAGIKSVHGHAVDAETCPAPITINFVPDGRTGEGKARELDIARHIAIWPDATDEQLSMPKDQLTQALKERLPALIEQLHKIVTSEPLNFMW